MISHKRIVIIGNEGAGKGTQITLLQKKLHLPVIAVGALLREEIARKTAMGKRIQKFVDKGKLAPNKYTNTLVERKLKRYWKKGFILDGYPRDPEQIGFLFSVTTVDVVIGIIISPREVRNRILNRRQCPKGHMYHLTYFPPKKKGICDIDGLPLFKRNDATISAIRHREEVFNNHVKRVIQAFKNFGLYTEVDGEQSPEKVHKDIMRVLETFQKCP